MFGARGSEGHGRRAGGRGGVGGRPYFGEMQVISHDDDKEEDCEIVIEPEFIAATLAELGGKEEEEESGWGGGEGTFSASKGAPEELILNGKELMDEKRSNAEAGPKRVKDP